MSWREVWIRLAVTIWLLLFMYVLTQIVTAFCDHRFKAIPEWKRFKEEG